ncbi:MAG TPA: hypothetical protein VD997_02750 [Phycisphaerales bacterium]|nr:hypothetical protein [Phycisphaerales bacterium]
MKLSVILAAGLAVSVGWSAFAQSKEQPASDEPVLKGPTVKEEGVAGEQRQFAPGRARGKEMMGGEIPHRLFMRAVESLRNSDDMDLRLTPEQQSQIRRINEAFTSSMGKYREDHREEVRELLGMLTPEDRRRAMEFLARQGENRRPQLDQRKNSVTKKDGQKSGSMEEQTDPRKAEEARERIKELLAGAPTPADTHAKIHALLTDPQKQAFKDQLQKLRDEMSAQREMDQRKKDGVKPGAGKKPEAQPEKKPEAKPEENPSEVVPQPSSGGGEKGPGKRAGNGQDPKREAIKRYLDKKEWKKKQKEKAPD